MPPLFKGRHFRKENDGGIVMQHEDPLCRKLN